jgi:hypothetical protein
MLVLSMSYKEMYDCLESDIPKLNYQRERCLPKICKAFRKENRFPNYKWIEYEPSSGNKYLIIYYAPNSLYNDNPFVRYCAIVWNDNYRFVITWMKGKYKHPNQHEFEATPMLYVYTNHFFNQYKTRFLKDELLSSNEVLSRFVMRNLVYTPIEINEKVNRNISNKDDSYRRGFSVEDGICFTRYDMDGVFYDIDEKGKDEVYTLCFIFTTYYNKDKMSAEQIDAISIEEEKAWALYHHVHNRI